LFVDPERGELVGRMAGFEPAVGHVQIIDRKRAGTASAVHDTWFQQQTDVLCRAWIMSFPPRLRNDERSGLVALSVEATRAETDQKSL